MAQSDRRQWEYVFARIFNRTALGAWTLYGLYLGSQGEYAIAAAMIFIGIPAYFLLSDHFNAP